MQEAAGGPSCAHLCVARLGSLFGAGYSIDLAEAVRSHEWASVTVGTKDPTEHLKRLAVRTAILLVQPEKG
jgi:hypothetical protein